MARNDYGLVINVGPFYLFKRGTVTPGTDEALKALGIHRPKNQRQEQGTKR